MQTSSNPFECSSHVVESLSQQNINNVTEAKIKLSMFVFLLGGFPTLFNNMLRSARNPIECAFGRLKARWSILTRKMDLNLKLVPTVVLACFVLHNFCEVNNHDIDMELVKSQIERNQHDEAMHKNIPDPVYSGDTGEGEMIRQTLTDYIKLNMPDKLLM